MAFITYSHISLFLYMLVMGSSDSSILHFAQV